MVDLSSEFGVAAPISEQSAQTGADAQLSRLVLLVEALHRLLTDPETHVESAVVQNLCTIWHIDKVPTTAYYQGNGAGERLNQTSNRGMQKMLIEKKMEEWDIILS